MAQVIIFTTNNGNVALCIPTGEIPIEQVLIKDCPPGAIIVDESILPQGADAEFFDAWRLNGDTVSVDFESAKADKLERYNASAVYVAQKRQLNTLSGIDNEVDDATWIAKLTSDRKLIADATTTDQLVAIVNPK